MATGILPFRARFVMQCLFASALSGGLACGGGSGDVGGTAEEQSPSPPLDASVGGGGGGKSREAGADARAPGDSSGGRDGASAACSDRSQCAGSQDCRTGVCCEPSCGARACGRSQCGDPCGTCEVGTACSADGVCVSSSWQPAAGPLKTQWTDKVDPLNVLPEYPRPQLVRDEWLSLNGIWEFQRGSASDPVPHDRALAGTILVPFPIESSLSGVMQKDVVDAWYRRKFVVPPEWANRRVMLHFDAVDWEAEAYLNGKSLGLHRGGYDAFRYDVTDLLAPNSEQELIVRVHDATDQARGKQSTSPSGIFYTACTGIWQTVWLEPVPDVSIVSVDFTPDVGTGHVALTVHASNDTAKLDVSVSVKAAGAVIATARGALGAPIDITITTPRLWSPDDPFLYDVDVSLLNGTSEADHVTSYFGMRKIEVADVSGHRRILLNGKAIFMLGPLDQGFWPDGIYRAPTDDALRFDLDKMKELGLNMLRKHIKVEPERWYYYTDKLGLLVWQDMPSGSNGDDASKKQFEAELSALVSQHRAHPSIVVWIPFNEGWGEYDPERIAASVMTQDPTRLVTPASGWNDAEAGHIQDQHCYPGPCAPTGTSRARVNGEFGGWGLATPGHQWSGQLPIYNIVANAQALNDALVGGLAEVVKLRDEQGLNGAVYTQITDVETELNGLFSYDRAVAKVDVQRYRPAAAALTGAK